MISASSKEEFFTLLKNKLRRPQLLQLVGVTPSLTVDQMQPTHLKKNTHRNRKQHHLHAPQARQKETATPEEVPSQGGNRPQRIISYPHDRGIKINHPRQATQLG